MEDVKIFRNSCVFSRVMVGRFDLNMELIIVVIVLRFRSAFGFVLSIGYVFFKVIFLMI